MDKLFKQLEDLKKKSNHNISRGMIPLYAFGTVVAQIKNQLCLVVCANRGLHRGGATGGPPSEDEVTKMEKGNRGKGKSVHKKQKIHANEKEIIAHFRET